MSKEKMEAHRDEALNSLKQMHVNATRDNVVLVLGFDALTHAILALAESKGGKEFIPFEPTGGFEEAPERR